MTLPKMTEARARNELRKVASDALDALRDALPVDVDEDGGDYVDALCTLFSFVNRVAPSTHVHAPDATGMDLIQHINYAMGECMSAASSLRVTSPDVDPVWFQEVDDAIRTAYDALDSALVIRG